MPDKPFRFQIDDLNTLRRLSAEHRSVLYQAPTGSGKTFVAGYVMQAAAAKGIPILVLLNRKELINQFYKTLREHGLIRDVGVVAQGWPPSPWAPIQLGSVMSWVRRKPAFTPGLIIIDEAHHVAAESWKRILAMYPDARVLGLTATPLRLDGQGLDPWFNIMHCSLQIDQLVRIKRLAPTRTIRVPTPLKRKDLKMRGSDLDASSVDDETKAVLMADGLKFYQNYIPGEQAIVFCIDRANSMQTAERFQAAGIRAEHVDGETPPGIRTRIFELYARGDIAVLCNVELATEGVDFPACNAVIHMRPTASLTQYMQMNGRCMRFQPDKVAVIGDLVGNYFIHGLPDENRTWQLEGAGESNRQREKKQRGANLRMCGSCMTLYAAHKHICPGCGSGHPGRPVRELDVDLVEEPPKSQNPKPEPLDQGARKAGMRDARILLANGDGKAAWDMIQQVRQEYGYKPGWAFHMAEMIGIPKEERR